jgi:hypothetical protein
LQCSGQRFGLIKRAGAGLPGTIMWSGNGTPAFGVKLGLGAGRCYGDYKELIAKEAVREGGIEVVSIATPNRTHYEITKACLETPSSRPSPPPA